MQTVLMHACCGPCSTACVERLNRNYNVILYYYNPNIMDEDEYLLRQHTLEQFVEKWNTDKMNQAVNLIIAPYNPAEFISSASGYEQEPERGARCSICYDLRLRQTAAKASEIGADYFTTTLSVSPHKDYETIKRLGLKYAALNDIEFMDIDFKKNNGFGRSVELSKEYELYRQRFCGCEYSR